MEIRSEEQYKVSKWSGGTTTELFIYPENADYAKHDFKVRISSATVETNESQFTKLNGVKRMLMILNGEMKLIHKGHRELVMKPYDIDTFMGDWETSSYGKVTDFNLMLKDGAQGTLFYKELKKQENDSMRLECPATEQKLFVQKVILYIIEGSGKIDGKQIEESQIVVLNHYCGEEYYIENTGSESLKLAVCHIFI